MKFGEEFQVSDDCVCAFGGKVRLTSPYDRIMKFIQDWCDHITPIETEDGDRYPEFSYSIPLWDTAIIKMKYAETKTEGYGDTQEYNVRNYKVRLTPNGVQLLEFTDVIEHITQEIKQDSDGEIYWAKVDKVRIIDPDAFGVVMEEIKSLLY